MSDYGFLLEAEAEYLAAVRFYEEQRAGLGDALICEFERVIELIIEKPEISRLVHPSGIRIIRAIALPLYGIL